MSGQATATQLRAPAEPARPAQAAPQIRIVPPAAPVAAAVSVPVAGAVSVPVAAAVSAPVAAVVSVPVAAAVSAAATAPQIRIVPPVASPPPAPVPVPVATSAEGCASGECLPEVEKDAQEAEDAAEVIEAGAKPVLSAADRWKGAVEVIRNANARLGKSLSYARLVSLGAGDARLAFPTDAGFHRATVFGHARAELESVLTQHLGEKIHLAEEKSEAAYLAANRSVAETEAHAKVTRERDIEAKVRENPAVLSVLRMLGGSLEHVQVLDANSVAREDVPSSPDDEQ